MKIAELEPYIRAAQIQGAVLEGEGERMAYDFRLFLICGGAGSIVIEGEEQPAEEGTLILIPPEVGYRFIGRMRVAVLNFDLSTASRHRTKAICPPPRAEFDRALLFDPARLEELDRPILRPADSSEEGLVQSVVEEWNRGDGSGEAAAAAYLKLLLVGLIRVRHPADPEEELCRRVAGYIRLHAADRPDNRELGRRFGYHPVYLGQLYRRVTGRTLHRELTEAGLALACRYLSETALSVEEVAALAGFASRAHFCTAFKSAYGLSPLEWRRKG